MARPFARLLVVLGVAVLAMLGFGAPAMAADDPNTIRAAPGRKKNSSAHTRATCWVPCLGRYSECSRGSQDSWIAGMDEVGCPPADPVTVTVRRPLHLAS